MEVKKSKKKQVEGEIIRDEANSEAFLHSKQLEREFKKL
jgi:hypothetical protein